jgi:hypothetical protein
MARGCPPGGDTLSGEPACRKAVVKPAVDTAPVKF